MTVKAILDSLSAAGFRLQANGDKIHWKGSRPLPEDLRRLLIDHKPLLLRELSATDEDLIALACDRFEARSVTRMSCHDYLRLFPGRLPKSRL